MLPFFSVVFHDNSLRRAIATGWNSSRIHFWEWWELLDQFFLQAVELEQKLSCFSVLTRTCEGSVCRSNSIWQKYLYLQWKVIEWVIGIACYQNENLYRTNASVFVWKYLYFWTTSDKLFLLPETDAVLGMSWNFSKNQFSANTEAC